MSKQVFSDGSVLLTGKELEIALEAIINRRGSYDIDCSFCVHDGKDDYCEGCSILDRDRSCSCHINPPCGKCVDSKFEVSPYLINYEHITVTKDTKRKIHRWECFKGDKEIFEKLEAIEKSGLKITAETLTTGEIAMYIEDGVEKDYEIEICFKADFKKTMCKMILSFEQQEKE